MGAAPRRGPAGSGWAAPGQYLSAGPCPGPPLPPGFAARCPTLRHLLPIGISKPGHWCAAARGASRDRLPAADASRCRVPPSWPLGAQAGPLARNSSAIAVRVEAALRSSGVVSQLAESAWPPKAPPLPPPVSARPVVAPSMSTTAATRRPIAWPSRHRRPRRTLDATEAAPTRDAIAQTPHDVPVGVAGAASLESRRSAEPQRCRRKRPGGIAPMQGPRHPTARCALAASGYPTKHAKRDLAASRHYPDTSLA